MNTDFAGLDLNDPVVSMELSNLASTMAEEISGIARTLAFDQGIIKAVDPEDDEGNELAESCEWQYVKAVMLAVARCWNIEITVGVNNP